jgi:phospholipase C
MDDDDVTRRGFLAGTAGAAAIAATAGVAASAQSANASVKAQVTRHLPEPSRSGIDHIVVVMMENRSFDHYLGWLPGADGRQAGLTFTDATGATHATHHLTVPYGCGFNDPDHSYAGGRVEFNQGKCDGWLRAGRNDAFSIGYFKSADLGFHGHAARDWTVCDRYFAAILGPTFPNRIFQHAAQTDRITNTFAISQTPTIWDRLAEKKVSHRYYFSDVPMIALWGTKHLDISRRISHFYDDARKGDLPAVSFVEPGFLGEAIQGLSEDEHPLADIRYGQAFLNRVYEAIVSSPNWERTVLVVNYDEWGGFFDHLPPPAGPDPRPDLGTDGTGQRGFRVPCIVISPRSRRGAVVSEVYDHTSVLKMIEWRHRLEPLTVRDKAARNLAEVLDFESRPNLHAPRYKTPVPFTLGCATDPVPPGGTARPHVHHGDDWYELDVYARAHGFGH